MRHFPCLLDVLGISGELMMKTKLILLVLASVGLSVAQADSVSKKTVKQPQRSFVGDVPTTVADSVAETLKFAERNFLGVAEAMPEDKYGYVPTAGNFDGVRSF